MKYNKTVISALVLLSLFSAGCLGATYKVTQDAKKLGTSPMVNQDIKNGLKNRLESIRQHSALNSTTNVAFNDVFPFPTQSYFDNFEKELNSIFDESRKEMYELNSKAIRSSNFMVENTDKTFKVSAIVQNVTKEMLNVSVHNGFLTVSAEEKSEEAKKDDKTKEVKAKHYSSFKKVIKLPKNIDADKAKVSFKENLLVIEFPKTELKEDKPIVLEVK